MIGKTISHYKILERLGEGGMGVVYRAEDTKLGRSVALKFISPTALAHEEDKTRFLREAQTAAALSHPHIATIYEIDETDDKTFIAMEYVKGESLKEKIKAGPLTLGETLDMAIQVTEGIQEAHERGIVHRDIKSSNIMITEKKQAKIMDFGLAKFEEKTQITKTATIMGTVAYMSPEQACGEAADSRSDIWSLGVVMYEMLTGRLPFKGDYDQVVLHSILNSKPEPVTGLQSGIPLGIERIVNKCLEKAPDTRYQTAADLREDLNRVKRGLGTKDFVSLPVATSPSLLQKKIWRNAILLSASLTLIFLVSLVVPPARDSIKAFFGMKKLPSDKYLAILPFTVVSEDPEDETFSMGITEFLASRLTQLESHQTTLWITPMSEVRRSGIQSPSEARKVLGVTLAFTASIQRLGEKILVTMNLVDTTRLLQLRSRDIEVSEAGLYSLHRDIVNSAVEMLDVEVNPEIRRAISSGESTVPGTSEFYVRGLGYMQRYESEESLDTAVSLFEKALEKDPSYALAYAGLGEAYWRKYRLTHQTELVDIALSHARRAIELDKSLAPVHVTLGLIHREKGEYDKAIEEFERALEIDPHSSDACRELALAFEELGKLEEAEKIYAKAIVLKPSYWSGYSYLGVFYFLYGRYEEAEKMFLKVTELTPDNPRGFDLLGAVYSQTGRNDQAISMFKKSLAIKPGPTAYSNLGTIYFFEGRYADSMAMYEQAIQLGVNNHTIQGNLADSYRYVYGDSEKTQNAYLRAVQLTEKQLSVNPKNADLHGLLARYVAIMGDKKRALKEISLARELAQANVMVLLKCIQAFELVGEREKALNSLQELIHLGGSLEFVEKNPDLSGLRQDSRYIQLLDKMKDTHKERIP